MPRVSVKLVPALGIAASAFLLFVIESSLAGYIVLAVSIAWSALIERDYFRDLLLIGIGLTIVSSISVAADISYPNMALMGAVLTASVAVPFLIDRFAYKREAIRFPWRAGQPWTPLERSYLFAVPLLGWLILPFYFITSGAYRNWPVVDQFDEIARLFVGVNAVGTWDELFFICTVFALLRRHFPLLLANLLQAAIFVSFLWELGYQSWGPLLTIPFALLQGYIFTQTKSLTYVLIVHLLFDFIVWLVIVHAHNPGLLPI